MLAVRQQHMDAAVALLHYSADVNGSDHWGDTPLHMAVERGSMALVTMLHEEGADLDAINAKVSCVYPEGGDVN
jgi:ankyrin repeat protein